VSWDIWISSDSVDTLKLRKCRSQRRQKSLIGTNRASVRGDGILKTARLGQRAVLSLYGPIHGLERVFGPAKMGGRVTRAW